MRSSLLASSLFLKGVVAVANYSAIDPVNNFCLRVYHQSVVKNDVLYIDGGLEAFIPVNYNGNPEGDTPVLGYNPSLITTPMTDSWDWKTNVSISAINKTQVESSGTYPPVFVRGALYAGAQDDPDLYLYGGTTSWVNSTFPGFYYPIPPLYSLWSYDTNGRSWDQYDTSISLQYRPAGGAYAESTTLGLGFYMNGFIDNGSDPDYEHFADFQRYMGGIVVVNTSSQEAVNISTSQLPNSPRIMGGLAHLPNVGEEGVVMAMGGVTKSPSDSALSDKGSYISFDSVDFLDIASIDFENATGTWYSQSTTGEIPLPRTDFCVVAVSAPDNSSHEIYLYGGKGETQLFDDVYVLSVPAFTWVKITQGNSPRYGHTCHLVGRSQMVTVGGANSDNLTAWCDWESRGLAVLDLNKPRGSGWGSVFNANAKDYQVSEAIYSVIGGDSKGNATMSAPTGGFSSEDVGSFFNGQQHNNKGNGRPSGGAIAGAVIGAIAGAALIAAAVVLFFVWRREKRRRAAAEAQAQMTSRGSSQEDPSAIHEAPSSTDYGPTHLIRSLLRNPKRKAELPAADERVIAEMEAPVHELEGGTGAVELDEKRAEAV